MIDKTTQDKLKAKYNPEGSNLRNYQLRLLEILKFIDKVCKENNIKYWLSNGSCLGAVRHGGFIPWDDDIDVDMMEEDYFKFKKIVNKLNHDKYIFHDMENDSNYYFTFGKVRDLNSKIEELSGSDKFYRFNGCYVDIFPVVPSNSEKLSRIGRYVGVLLARASINGKKISIISSKALFKTCIPILRYLSTIGICKKVRYNMGNPVLRTFRSDFFAETVLMNFEGQLFPIPKNYDSYLRTIYGNYQELPSEEDLHIHLAKYELF